MPTIADLKAVLERVPNDTLLVFEEDDVEVPGEYTSMASLMRDVHGEAEGERRRVEMPDLPRVFTATRIDLTSDLDQVSYQVTHGEDDRVSIEGPTERCSDHEFVASHPFEWRTGAGSVLVNAALLNDLEETFDQNG